MNRKVAIIVALQAFLIIVMFWVIIFYGKDEYEAYTRDQDEEIASPERVSSELGATVITISAEAQAQSDIKTTELKTGSHQETLSAFGSVISIDPLIEMRTRYLTAVADANVARASLANSRQEYQRLLQLNQDNRNVSDRVVVASEALYKTDQAKLQAAQVQAGNVRDNMRQLWGETLAMQATQSNSSALQNLLQYKEVLVQVTLPFDAASTRTGIPYGSALPAVRERRSAPSMFRLRPKRMPHCKAKPTITAPLPTICELACGLPSARQSVRRPALQSAIRSATLQIRHQRKIQHSSKV